MGRKALTLQYDEVPKDKTKGIKVRATRVGYYGHGSMGVSARYEGDTFYLTEREIPDWEVTANGAIPRKNPDGTTKMRVLSPEDQFSANWMERVPEDTPLQASSSGEVLKREINDILAAKGMSPAVQEG